MACDLADNQIAATEEAAEDIDLRGQDRWDMILGLAIACFLQLEVGAEVVGLRMFPYLCSSSNAVLGKVVEGAASDGVLNVQDCLGYQDQLFHSYRLVDWDCCFVRGR